MASKDRFATEVTKDDIMQAIQSRILKKTLLTTKWACGNWNSVNDNDIFHINFIEKININIIEKTCIY